MTISGVLAIIGKVISKIAIAAVKTATAVGKTVGIVGTAEKMVAGAVGKALTKVGLAKAASVAIPLVKTAFIVGDSIAVNKLVDKARNIPVLNTLTSIAGEAAKASIIYKIV